MQLTKFMLLALFTFLIFLISLNFKRLQKNYSQLKKVVFKTNSEQVSVITTPPPHKAILPLGPETYNFSHGSAVKGPKVSSITYSPLIISPNTTQDITAVFSDNEKIKEVTFTFETDTKSKQVVTLNQSSISPNTWTGSWTPTDTAEKNYSVLLQFVGEKDTYQETMKIL